MANTLENLKTLKDLHFNKFNECGIRSFIYGNIDQEIITTLKKKLDKLNCGQQILEKKINTLYLSDGEENVYIRFVENKTDNNNVVYCFFEIGQTFYGTWVDKIVYTYLIDLMTREKFFNQLRTNEQLGYLVKSGVTSFSDVNGQLTGLFFAVQSNISPDKLRKRIKQFITDMCKVIENMSNDDIETYKTNLQNQCLMKFASPYNEFLFYETEIMSGDKQFDQKEMIYEGVHAVDKKSIIEFYNKYFINKETRKVRLLQIFAPNK